MAKNTQKRKSPTKSAIVDPAHVLLSAERVWLGNGVLADKMNHGDIRLVEPFVVLGALALELYFKGLHAIEHNGAVTHGHNLHDLFHRLSDESRLKITDEYNRLLPQSQTATELMKRSHRPAADFSIENVLKEDGEAFVRWRYSYEGGKLSGFFGADLIRDATWRRILELRPSFDSLNLSGSPWSKIGEVPLRRTIIILNATKLSPH